jgi:hypothetical protein
LRIEMHEAQSFAGNSRDGVRIVDEVAKHAGPALRGFVEKEQLSVVAVREAARAPAAATAPPAECRDPKARQDQLG